MRVTKRLAPFGYIAVDRPLAQLCYYASVPVTSCGDNVNSAHIFGGWRLGYTCCLKENPTWKFDDIVLSFLQYLDRELGRYAVYYVLASDLNTVRATPCVQ